MVRVRAVNADVIQSRPVGILKILNTCRKLDVLIVRQGRGYSNQATSLHYVIIIILILILILTRWTSSSSSSSSRASVAVTWTWTWT